MKANKMVYPSASEIRRVLRYDEISGKFYWTVKICNRVKIGDEAGSVDPSGYVRITLNRKRLQANRLAWIICKGDIPEGSVIDHKNNNRSDNSIDNLRVATYSQNNCNRRISKRNNTGVKGVTFDKQTMKFKAYVGINGIQEILGFYSTLDEAALAANNARSIKHGDYARYL